MPKINITNEEYEMLQEMRNLLRTQNNRGTANPLYGIMHMDKTYGIDPDYSTTGFSYIYDTEEYDKEGIIDLLLEHERTANALLEDELIEECDLDNIDKQYEVLSQMDSYDFHSFHETIIEDIHIVHYREEYTIYPYSFSIFEQDSFDHLEMNGHNIRGKRHTYAFSNQRTPRMNKLKDFLKNLSCFGVYSKDVHN